ncbi:hypothetical protein HHK36_010697 [Tetracentron sinense]|uniref:RING-type E3 ubiquitin transferase n=1 Tax=Tetracentron sinense TaxID=13715 RepID=A0A834ZCF2_TETSI|nr:hypothetical protein HHK36_010697 [Tetracentron sinense]
MFSPPESPSSEHEILPTIHSYDGKVMLAAIISLLLVILFVLLLHLYARWFTTQAHPRRRPSLSISHVVLGPTQVHHIGAFTYVNTHSECATNGLDASIIASLPLFVYESSECENGLECVVCLGVFKEDDIGRNLPKCGHPFHVECIDMWLQSHSTCPICRASVLPEKSTGIVSSSSSIEVIIPPEGSRDPPETISGESVVIDGDSHLEISFEVPNSESIVSKDSPSTSSSLGCSLKRMLSRNRSERRVYPSSNVNHELDV